MIWNLVRPMYNAVLAVTGKNGLQRNINGSDMIKVMPHLRQIPENYEPEVWHHLMAQIKPDDVILDVGAYIGIYTVAIAKRLNNQGKVIAFEPDTKSYATLQSMVQLNQVSERVEAVNVAVGAVDQNILFEMGRESQSHIDLTASRNVTTVRCIRLDTLVAGQKVDIIKIDVEGYEKWVLEGANQILSRGEKAPRFLHIEVHPFAWSQTETSSESLLALLKKFGYQAYYLHPERHGESVTKLSQWENIYACKPDRH